MTPMTPEAMALSGELAALLGQQPQRDGDLVRVPSQRRAGVVYDVLLGLDGNTQCNCPGFEHYGHCWHCEYVKELNMTTALAPIKVQPPVSALPSLDELKTMDMVAANLVESKAVAIPQQLKTKEDIRAVILAGWEMGVRPMTALRHIAVINGKTEPDGQLMAGILQSKEPDARFEIMEDTDDATTVRLTRPAKNIVREYRVTMNDAKRAGLLNSTAWQKYPRDMRRWHAVKRLCRAYAPDVINGIASVYLGDMPPAVSVTEEEREYIDAEVSVAPSLYNEGDEPEDEPEPISPEVKARVDAALKELPQTWDADSRRKLYDRFQSDYPAAFTPTRKATSNLTMAQALELLSIINGDRQEKPEAQGRSTGGTNPERPGSSPVQSTSPDAPPAHTCEATYDPDADTFVCDTCGRDMNEEMEDELPEGAETPQGALFEANARE